MGKKAVIELKNVVKTFGRGKNKITVLNHVNLNIYSKEFVILFGPSGCGKSTLLYCMAGLEIPDVGHVHIRNLSLSSKGMDDLADIRKNKIGIVFQQFNLIKEMSLIDNVAMPQMFKRVSMRTRRDRAIKMLDKFGLKEAAKRRPTELSGGQQQRVAIARALVNSPWIIMADEPTGNLDSKTAEEVMAIITDLSRKSMRTVVLVTHNPEYLAYADRVIYMKDGEIVDDKRNKKPKNFNLEQIIEKREQEEKEKLEEERRKNKCLDKGAESSYKLEINEQTSKKDTGIFRQIINAFDIHNKSSKYKKKASEMSVNELRESKKKIKKTKDK